MHLFRLREVECIEREDFGINDALRLMVGPSSYNSAEADGTDAEESEGSAEGATETETNWGVDVVDKPAVGHPKQLSTNSPAIDGKILEIERADDWREMLLAVIAEYQAKHEAYPTWPQFWGFLLENPPKEFGVTVHPGKRGVPKHEACVKRGEEDSITKGNLKRRFDRLLKPTIKLQKTDR